MGSGSTSFKERIDSIISDLRVHVEPSLFMRRSPPLDNIASQKYQKCGRIAEHEAVPHPVGTLFKLNRDYEIHPYADVGGQVMLENATDDASHTVTATYGEAFVEKLSLSSSHMLGKSSHLKLQYTSDLCKDAYCSLYALHNFDDESLLHARYSDGLVNDPVVEVEIQHQQKRFRAIGKLQKFLGSGHQVLSVQSENLLPADITIKNSVSTDLRNEMSVGIELVSTSTIHTSALQALFGLGKRELSMKGSRSFGKNILAQASTFTDFNMHQNISMETKCKVLGENEVSVKMSRASNGIQEVNVKASLFFGTNSWKWKYRKQTVDGHLVGLEWEKKGLFDNLLLLSIELNRQGFACNGQINHYFVR